MFRVDRHIADGIGALVVKHRRERDAAIGGAPNPSRRNADKVVALIGQIDGNGLNASGNHRGTDQAHVQRAILPAAAAFASGPTRSATAPSSALASRLLRHIWCWCCLRAVTLARGARGHAESR